MKRTLFYRFAIIAITMLLTGHVFAQAINGTTYFYSSVTGSMTGVGTPPVLIDPGSDNAVSAVTDIGFDFWFAGTKYTQFSVTEDGLIKLGSTVIVSEPVNNLTSGLNLPKIAPYWDDLATSATGNVVCLVQGTAPSRFLTIQWNNVILKNAVGTPLTTFQARLYENGNIFFRASAAPAVNAGGYSMGIASTTTDFASVTVTGATTNSLSYTIANNNNTAGASRQIQFTTDNTAPTINANNALPALPTQGTANRVFSTVIADQAGNPVSGIPTTGSFVPCVYYKKNSGDWVFNPATLSAGNDISGTWTFTIDHALIEGVIPGDMISYFVVAQDKAYLTIGHTNIKSYPTGAIGIDVTSITTPPATIPYYIIGGSLSGTKTVGVGGDYTSLTLPGGLFDQINAGELSGNLTVNIISDLTSETGAKGLNAWVNNGGTFSVTVNPVGNRIVSGITVNGGNGSVIPLNGVTGLTIDGLNDGTNSLTFIQTGQYYVGSMIDIKGASFNTVKNVTINGYGASNYAISLTNSTLPSSNNTVSNCNISTSVLIPNTANCGNGIGLLGSATLAGDNNKIENNTITNFVYYHIVVTGKYTNTQISGNNVYNTVGTSWHNTYSAVNISTATGGGTTAVFNNNIHDILTQTNFSAGGIPAIYSNGVTGTTTTIYNNEIHLDIAYNPLVTRFGIRTNNAGAVNIYYNTIYIGGTDVTEGNSYGLYRGGTGVTNIRNNAVFNARSNSTGIGKHYGIYTTSTTSLTSDYNDVYTPGTGGVFGFSTVDRLTLTDWQTATIKDANSISLDPLFTSLTNFLPQAGSPLIGAAQTIAGITLDITGLTRDLSIPTIGAYEVAPPACENPTLAGTIGPDQNGCGSLDPVTIGDPESPASGETGIIEYKWQSSVAPFTTWNDILSNTVTYDPGTITATTQFQRLARVDCKNDWVGAAVSNIATMTVYPIPAVTSTNSATICSGISPAISLTSTVPSTFTWVVGTITGEITGASNGNGGVIDQVLINAGTAAGTVEYLVTPTSVAGLCPGMVYSIIITVNPIIPVSVHIYTFNNPVCADNEIIIFADPTNGGVSPVFTWKVNGGVVGGNANNYSYFPENGDVITCELTPGNDVVCPSVAVAVSNEVIMIVSQNVIPTIAISSTTSTVCAGGSLEFSAIVTNEGITPSFVWKVNDIVVGTNSPGYIYTAGNYLTQTIDVVTCELTSSSPCSSVNPVTSVPVNITVNPILAASVSIAADDNTVCTGTIVTLTAIPTNGGISPSYQWYNGSAMVGSDSPVYADVFNNGDVISVVMTSNATPCLINSPATSNSITMTVSPWPQLQMTANGVTVTDSHDGINDVGIVSVCNIGVGYNNVYFSNFSDLMGATPANRIKVRREIVSLNNATFTMSNSTDLLSAYITLGTYRRSARLINPSVPGEIVVRWRAWLDVNNNNVVDGNECAGDWIVYTITVEPVLPASVSVSADVNPICESTVVLFTALPSNGGETPFYQWKVNNVNAGTNSSTFSYTPLNNDIVKCVMTSSAPCATGNPATSNSIVMTVIPNLNASVSIAADSNPVYGIGTSVTLTATPSNGGPTPVYQWYNGANPVGADSPVYTYIPTNGDVITVVMISNATPCLTGSPATSNSVTMTVFPNLPVGITITADANPVCAFTSVTYTATPINGGTTPTYQWKVNNINTGSNNPVFNYAPIDNEVITCELTSSDPSATGNPATSNSIQMIVYLRSQLQMSANGVTVSDNHDGIDDVGTFSVCNIALGYNNVSFSNFSDLLGATPANRIKVRREIVSLNNATFTMSNSTDPLNAYITLGTYRRSARLINPSVPGEIVVRWRAWLDVNNNNAVDGNECAGDWIVYTITVNPCLPPVVKAEEIATEHNDSGNIALDLRAYVYQNMEIRIVGDVESGAIATLFDLQGRAVLVKNLEEGDLNVMPIPGLIGGIYILRVIDHGKMQSIKIPMKF